MIFGKGDLISLQNRRVAQIHHYVYGYDINKNRFIPTAVNIIFCKDLRMAVSGNEDRTYN